MYSDPNTPRIRPKGLVKFLGDEDVIESLDLVREVGYKSYSDSVDYGQIRDMDWRRVPEAIPGWIGKKVGEMKSFSPSVLNGLEIIRLVP